MKKIIDWLMLIEHTSGRFYRASAGFFHNAELKAFLKQCAEDEGFHYKTMADAAQTIRTGSGVRSAFTVDKELRNAIEKPFLENQRRLDEGSLTEAQLVDCIVEAEFSEWNDIFLYVVNSLKEMEVRFKPAAAKIQNHLWHVETYLNTTEYGRQKIEIIRTLKPVWKEKILIVEDDPAISELLTAIFSSDGEVDTAENGKIGLEKIRKRYYRLIVSDIDMPVMDGMAMFNQAATEFKDIADRFLFLTGRTTGPVIAFFRTNNLKYLGKPAGITAIRNIALSVLHGMRAN